MFIAAGCQGCFLALTSKAYLSPHAVRHAKSGLGILILPMSLAQVLQEPILYLR